MSRIVVFPQSIDPAAVTAAFPAHEPLLVHSKSECAAALVGAPSIDCLVVQRDVYGPEYQAFLSSLKLHFPFLEIILVAPAGPTSPPDGCHFIDGPADDAGLTAAIAACVKAPRMADHRGGIRFDWPLRGQLEAGGQKASCKVRAFSYSGAFLEIDAPLQAGAAIDGAFQIGAAAALRVEFLNSFMTVSCECIRRQDAQGSEPAGYGVRFLDISDQARELGGRIVRDALIQALLYPEQEPVIPTLSGDDLLVPGFEQMEL
jgi:hypothetical protein